MTQHPSHSPASTQRTGKRGDVHAVGTIIDKVADVSRSLKHAAMAIEKLVHLAAGNAELTIGHYVILLHLSQVTTCKQVDLKGDTKIAPAYLTRLLDELTERGLLRRHRSSSDRRQVLLALTAAGREVAAHFQASLDKLVNQAQREAIDSIGTSCEQFIARTMDGE